LMSISLKICREASARRPGMFSSTNFMDPDMFGARMVFRVGFSVFLITLFFFL